MPSVAYTASEQHCPLSFSHEFSSGISLEKARTKRYKHVPVHTVCTPHMDPKSSPVMANCLKWIQA